jgi:hypothetical protein
METASPISLCTISEFLYSIYQEVREFNAQHRSNGRCNNASETAMSVAFLMLTELNEACHSLAKIESPDPETVSILNDFYRLFAYHVNISRIAKEKSYAARFLEGLRALKDKAEYTNALVKAKIKIETAQAGINKTASRLEKMQTTKNTYVVMKKPYSPPTEITDRQRHENLSSFNCEEELRYQVLLVSEPEGYCRIVNGNWSLAIQRKDIDEYFDLVEDFAFPVALNQL